jgi:hypothetical protein
LDASASPKEGAAPEVGDNYFHDKWNHGLHFDTGYIGALIAWNTFVNSGNTPIVIETNAGTAIIRGQVAACR